MVTELLQKYIWLVQTFIRAGERGLTLQEISDKWERRWDAPYSRRTFNNHRKDVEDVFGIYIECNRSTNCYFIEYSADVAEEIQKEEIHNKCCSTNKNISEQLQENIVCGILK